MADSHGLPQQAQVLDHLLARHAGARVHKPQGPTLIKRLPRLATGRSRCRSSPLRPHDIAMATCPRTFKHRQLEACDLPTNCQSWCSMHCLKRRVYLIDAGLQPNYAGLQAVKRVKLRRFPRKTPELRAFQSRNEATGLSRERWWPPDSTRYVQQHIDHHQLTHSASGFSNFSTLSFNFSELLSRSRRKELETPSATMS